MNPHIPTFTMKFGAHDLFETPVLEEEQFYRRLLEFIESNLKTNYKQLVLCYLEDEEGNFSEATLEEEGYFKSLNKCIEFYREEEQYETCNHIKKLIEKYGLQ
jgi:hypothetical protein